VKETLQKIIDAWMDKAIGGDPDAVHIVLRAVELQARLMGLWA